MKTGSILSIVLISAATSLLSMWGYSSLIQHGYQAVQEPGKLPVNYAGFFDRPANAGPVDFTEASTSSTPAVVHIKTRITQRQVTNNLPRRSNPFSDFFGDEDPFSDFFGGPRVIPEQRASGSGVIISNDGYIVTNNHVIDKADEINVTLSNRRSYKATLVGADPNTDLAVLKIDAASLPYMVYGNSDEVKLGQWVLAVGYPLNLDVTVTAGIISAKARSIGVNKSDRPVESFIQTDAAVNPGNSGGALVSTNGELIGINTAIASPTGSYAGYSYAIPVNIVKKVVNDLLKYGAVQRAYLGVTYPQDDLTPEAKNRYGIKEGNGVFVTGVATDGAAQQSGLKKGDFITKINGAAVGTGPELQEQIARYKPGDKISVTYERSGKESMVAVTLKNKAGSYNMVKPETILDKLGGAELQTLDAATAKKAGLEGGVLVKKLGNGVLKRTRMQEGFVITGVNGQQVNNLESLTSALASAQGTLRLEGTYPGYEGTYAYPLNLDEGDNYGNGRDNQ
jgi:Do/DeqQ family serine protease